jgi:hypothetical protein
VVSIVYTSLDNELLASMDLLGSLRACVTVISAYFIKKESKLIEKRLKAVPGAENKMVPKVIQTVAAVFLFYCFSPHRLTTIFNGLMYLRISL